MGCDDISVDRALLHSIGTPLACREAKHKDAREPARVARVSVETVRLVQALQGGPR